VAQDEINIIDISIIDNQMVEIPSGQIELRDDRKKHKWTADINPFLLLKFPVTQELYFDVTTQAPSSIKGSQIPSYLIMAANLMSVAK